MADLKERVFDYRMKNCLTQEEFANRCGVNKMTISRIENGREKLANLTIAKIMRIIESEGK